MQAWKVGFSETGDIALIELDIPDDATRLLYGPNNSLTQSGKCDFADVISITSMDSTHKWHKVEKAYSAYDFNFIYKVGTRIYADCFTKDYLDECTPGIHYFHHREVAAAYAWTGWFRIKQHAFWATLQSQSFEEYKKHIDLRYQTLRAEEKTQFMKELCDSLRESFGEEDASASND